MTKDKNLLGKVVIVKNPNHEDFMNWGTVVAVEGEEIRVSMTDDPKAVLVFHRCEIRLPRGQEK